MTLPSPGTLPPSQPTTPPPPPAAPAPPAPPSPVEFPISWLLDHAAGPLQYRALAEVARVTGPTLQKVANLPYSHPPALLLALLQGRDGTWNNTMLTLPSAKAERFEGVGTIHAVRRLLECGWDRESPPLARARRVLFRLLAEDDDPAYLFELTELGSDPELTPYGRGILREAAAAALAQAGYEGDPRLRGAARRILDRINEYLRSPLAEKPFVRLGNRHVLSADAMPPSVFSLTMLAYMPLFRNEHHDLIDRIYNYIAQPMPRQEPVQLVGNEVIPTPHLVLGDALPHRNAADADVPWALLWLELMARLNFLRRNEGWTKLFERFLDDRDRHAVWHPHKGTEVARSANPYTWSSYPLQSSPAGEEQWTDVTFRLGLIARLSGRPIELV